MTRWYALLLAEQTRHGPICLLHCLDLDQYRREYSEIADKQKLLKVEGLEPYRGIAIAAVSQKGDAS